MKKAAKEKPATKKSATKSGPAKAKKVAAKTPVKKAASMTKKSAAKAVPADTEETSKLIEQRIRDIGGWRGVTMGRMRELILAADPDIIEERKWIKPSNPFGVPTYSHAGLVLTLEVYKAAVKVTFAYGAKVPDPTRIFNASLLGIRRAVDIHEGETVDAEAFKALVKGAVAVNVAKTAN